MSTTQTVLGIDEVKGQSGAQGELRIYQVPVRIDGTYATATKPTFDLLAALQSQKRMAISAVNVKSAFLLRDYYDGTNRYSAPNASIVLSSTGNKVATFPLHATDSTHSNGDTNTEIADSTVLAGVIVIGVVCSVTASSFVPVPHLAARSIGRRFTPSRRPRVIGRRRPKMFMNAEGAAGAGGAGAPAAPTAQPVVVPPSTAAPVVVPGEEFKAMTPAQFTERIAAERAAGMKALLKELGAEKPEDIKLVLDAHKKKADAEKTELQRLGDSVKALEPKAARAESLEESIKKYLETEEKLIPDGKKALLNDLAPPASRPEERLAWISRAKSNGLFADAAAPPASRPDPKPATTMAPAGPKPPEPLGSKTKKQEYADLKKTSPLAAATFFKAHRAAIEADQS